MWLVLEEKQEKLTWEIGIFTGFDPDDLNC